MLMLCYRSFFKAMNTLCKNALVILLFQGQECTCVVLSERKRTLEDLQQCTWLAKYNGISMFARMRVKVLLMLKGVAKCVRQRKRVQAARIVILQLFLEREKEKEKRRQTDQ